MKFTPVFQKCNLRRNYSETEASLPASVCLTSRKSGNRIQTRCSGLLWDADVSGLFLPHKA